MEVDDDSDESDVDDFLASDSDDDDNDNFLVLCDNALKSNPLDI